jgi:hypothetical protein
MNAKATKTVAPATQPANAPLASVQAATSTQKPVEAKTVPHPQQELLGIQDPKKPVTAAQVHAFVRAHAGNNPANVEVVLYDGIDPKSQKPFPFTHMEKDGKRSQIMWALVNGVGKDKDRRLSVIKDYAGARGMSGEKMDDLLAAMNGGFSQKSKQWGTPFVKLRVRQP